MRPIARGIAATLALLLLAPPVPALAQERQRTPRDRDDEPWGQGAPGKPVDDLYDKSLRAAVEALKVYGRWDDPEQLARVNEIGYRVAQESGYREYPLTFTLIDMAEPNAFALPAGQIFVTRGMLSLGLTDDELAALLGHEIAHVVHEHGTRMQRRVTLLNILTQALVLGLALTADRRAEPVPGDPYGYGRSSGGDIVTGSYAASLILGELLLRSHSREFEDEADEDGQRWAAAAGYAPDGTYRLMRVLGSRLPDSGEYGYWRTHPFFDQRTTAAEARGRGLARGEEKPTAEFRSWSQRRVLDLGVGQPPESPTGRLVAASALAAWPQGAEAERLRLDAIHRDRSATLDEIPLSRDYGRLIAAYDREIGEVVALDEKSSLVGKLRTERDALATEAEALYPEAQKVWKEGVFQTPFLESFLSNWPEAEETPEVALALGEAYGRTARQADAVRLFLRAAEADPDSVTGRKASRALRNLAPALDQLSALAELAHQDQDPELGRLAEERLTALASTYDDIAAGSAYLSRFPDGELAETVTRRLNVLAENLYGEVLLYQGIGDHVRAIERIQKILNHAPASPAAQKLLERVVLPG